MDKKELLKLGAVYLLIFLIALYMDSQNENLEEGNWIYRDRSGGQTKEVELLLNVENVLEDYEVDLEIEPRRMTKSEAEECFSTAMKEIDEDMLLTEQSVCIRDNYANELVTAEWSFLPAGIVDTEGFIQKDKVSEEGTIVEATVVLQCDSYENIYRFPIQVSKPQMSLKEKIEIELEEWIRSQQLQEGNEMFQLPEELGGIAVRWMEKREYLALKILFLEGVSAVLLFFVRKKEKEDVIKRSRQQREMQYPEIVNQLLILMEAGMTTRQAWHKIASQYIDKRKKELVKKSDVYEAIVQMDRRLSEGECERTAYENFGMQMDVMCYRKLMRLFVHNLEKGSRDICQHLNLEAKQAYEKRILLAKKLGEEASTKMLIPMMLMMVLVMVIVMAPAIMSFSM